MTMLWSVLLALALVSGAWAQDLRIPQLVEGRGTAGGPVGGILSVQGVIGGTPLPVTPAAGVVHDVNLIQVLGVAPSAINPVPSRISNGAAFIDPRDRTWTLASPGDSVAATQSGIWTVQPGNTANTTAWLVTGTGGTFPVTGTFWQATQPVSGTVTANQGGAWTVTDTATNASTQSNYVANVTNAGATFTIGGTSKQVMIANDSNTYSVYVKIGSATATTSDFELKLGEILAGAAQVTQIAFITAPTETAAVRALVWR
jgi:hypothetical protein